MASAQKPEMNNLSNIEIIANHLEDTIFKYTNFYPNGTQVAIAFIEDGKVKSFYGVAKQNNTIRNIENKDAVLELVRLQNCLLRSYWRGQLFAMR